MGKVDQSASVPEAYLMCFECDKHTWHKNVGNGEWECKKCETKRGIE